MFESFLLAELRVRRQYRGQEHGLGLGSNLGSVNSCLCDLVVVVHSLSHVWLFVTPWTAAWQATCPSPSPRVCSNSWPLHWWCHPTISSSVIPFSSCHQSSPASGSFPVSQLFSSGGQSIEASASASVLPMNIQGWFPLGWTGLISLLSTLWQIGKKWKQCDLGQVS